MGDGGTGVAPDTDRCPSCGHLLDRACGCGCCIVAYCDCICWPDRQLCYCRVPAHPYHGAPRYGIEYK